MMLMLDNKINNNFFLLSLQACAPRYIYYVFMNRMDPVGVCFTGRNVTAPRRRDRAFATFRPCVELGENARNAPNVTTQPLSGLRAAIHLVLAQLQAEGARRHLLHGAQRFCRLFRVLPLQDK